MKYIIAISFVTTLLIIAVSCNDVKEKENNEPVGPGGWLKGSNTEKFGTIAGQLRGFDATMVEVGYRCMPC